MNIKLQLKLNTFKKRVSNLFICALRFILTPYLKYHDKTVDKEYKNRTNYIHSMSYEELMGRFAKYLIKNMIHHNETKKCYYNCNKRSRYDDLDDEGYIVYELRNISSRCKDKYLKSFYCISNRYNLFDDYIMDVEKGLQRLLKVEVEKLGCKVEFKDDRERLSEYWVKESEYQNTMVIYLPQK